MVTDRPSLFIGSSGEGLDVARAVKAQFDREADVDLWNEGAFKLNQSFLDSLLNAANLYDFAILILTPDDLFTSRGKTEHAARDNVLFEHGLFLGRLGPRRAFIICEESVRILSDYAGITVAKFRRREDGNLLAAVGTACNTIRTAMHENFAYAELTLLPSTALAIGYFENFVSKVYSSLVRKNFEIKVGEQIRDDLQFGEFSFTIIIPDTLSYVEKHRLEITIRESGLQKIHVHTPYRDFPFFIRGGIDEQRKLDLFDIPTTLLSSKRAIQLAAGRSFLGQTIDERRLERREIRNFRIALEHLLRENFGPEYARDIRLEGPSFLERPAR